MVLFWGLGGSSRAAVAEELSLRLVPTDGQELSFHRFVNRFDYKTLCDRPCSIDVEKSSLRLGAGLGSRTPVEGNLLQVVSDGRIEVRYIDRQPQRTAGFVVGAVGSIGALVLLGVSGGHALADDLIGPVPGDNSAAEWAVASLGVALSFGAVAGYLILRKDAVESVYVPVQTGSSSLSVLGP
ncbi:MAG: hypothetical protein AAGD10_21265 [Myxococcota bacterium]